MGGEAECPTDEDEQSILKSDQVPKMYEEPCAPGDEAAQPEALDVCHRCRATDRREVPLVAIAEWRRRMAPEPCSYDLRHVATLLHGDRRYPWKDDGRSVIPPDANHVAESE